jgi:hypothetical protein
MNVTSLLNSPAWKWLSNLACLSANSRSLSTSCTAGDGRVSEWSWGSSGTSPCKRVRRDGCVRRPSLSAVAADRRQRQTVFGVGFSCGAHQHVRVSSDPAASAGIPAAQQSPSKKTQVSTYLLRAQRLTSAALPHGVAQHSTWCCSAPCRSWEVACRARTTCSGACPH